MTTGLYLEVDYVHRLPQFHELPLMIISSPFSALHNLFVAETVSLNNPIEFSFAVMVHCPGLILSLYTG